MLTIYCFLAPGQRLAEISYTDGCLITDENEATFMCTPNSMIIEPPTSEMLTHWLQHRSGIIQQIFWEAPTIIANLYAEENISFESLMDRCFKNTTLYLGVALTNSAPITLIEGDKIFTGVISTAKVGEHVEIFAHKIS